MRLICPKCDAQYNVADDAIPKGGRDVQCSTCGHTWFQTEMSRVLSRPVSRVLSRPIPTAVKSEAREPVAATSRDVGANVVPHHYKEKSQTHQPKHRPVDPNIANILREEAAREHKNVPGPYKAAETKRPERKQADPVKIEATRARIAEMANLEMGNRGDSRPSKAAAAAAAGAAAGVATANPRSVPGINEINAVLREREQNAGAEITEAERVEAMRRQGFRRGFFLVLGLFAVIVTPYVLAGQIIENIPQSRETMTQYVAIMDQLRSSMNVTISGIVESVRALIGQFTG